MNKESKKIFFIVLAYLSTASLISCLFQFDLSKGEAFQALLGPPIVFQYGWKGLTALFWSLLVVLPLLLAPCYLQKPVKWALMIFGGGLWMMFGIFLGGSIGL